MDISRRSLLLAAGATLTRGLSEASEGGAILAEANKALREAIPAAASDPGRPVYHFHPPAQWCNDPNGTVYFKGWHHLFYQLNPYGSNWGHMHWGHARSRDLINWEHLPIALWPSKEKGEDHVYSGGALTTPDGHLKMFYTSIGKRDPEQWLAEPVDDDLIEWKKSPANPVMTLQIHGALTVDQWRDPFPFRENGVNYIVCGGNLRPAGGQGAVQLYRAANAEMTKWTHLGPIFVHPDRAIWNIECPNLFRVGNKWVLIISPQGPMQYFVGELDLKKPRFIAERQGILDPGESYATNISTDPSGRTLLWIWGKTENPAGKGWNSVMTIPRVLSLNDIGDLQQTPVAEVDMLREAVQQIPDSSLTNTSRAIGTGDCLDLECTIEVAKGTAGIRVRGTEILFNPNGGSLKVGDATGFAGAGKTVRLRVLLDKRAVEVYSNGAAIYHTVDAWNGPLDVELFSKGEAKFSAVRLWKMKPAVMDVSRLA